jgi:Ca2+-binding EF-hand superfamily protein
MGNGSSAPGGKGAGSRLNAKDMERAHRRFQRLAAGSQGQVDIAQFLGQSELGANPFTGRILQLFDEDKDGKLTATEFQAALEHFNALDSPEEQMRLAFRIYDLVRASRGVWARGL